MKKSLNEIFVAPSVTFAYPSYFKSCKNQETQEFNDDLMEAAFNLAWEGSLKATIMVVTVHKIPKTKVEFIHWSEISLNLLAPSMFTDKNTYVMSQQDYARVTKQNNTTSQFKNYRVSLQILRSEVDRDFIEDCGKILESADFRMIYQTALQDRKLNK